MTIERYFSITWHSFHISQQEWTLVYSVARLPLSAFAVIRFHSLHPHSPPDPLWYVIRRHSMVCSVSAIKSRKLFTVNLRMCQWQLSVAELQWTSHKRSENRSSRLLLFGRPLAFSKIHHQCGHLSLPPTYIDISVLFVIRIGMKAQILKVCRAAYSNLFRIAKIWTSVTTMACKVLVRYLVTSQLDTWGNTVLYCYPIACCTSLRMSNVRLPVSCCESGETRRPHCNSSIKASENKVPWREITWRLTPRDKKWLINKVQ